MISRRRISHPPFVADVAATTTAEEPATARLDQVGEDAALAIVERLVDLRERFEDDDAHLGERRVRFAAEALGRRAVERVSAKQARELARVAELGPRFTSRLANFFERVLDHFLLSGRRLETREEPAEHEVATEAAAASPAAARPRRTEAAAVAAAVMMAVPSTVTAAVRVAPAAVTVAQHLDERHQTNRTENEPQ